MINQGVSVDKYLGMTFDIRAFNCWDLAREFWREITGIDLGKQTPYELDNSALLIRAEQVATRLRELEAPKDPCLVLMRRARLAPHVGVFYKGRVLHINKNGAEFAELHHVTATFPHVNYYTTEPA